MTDSTHTPGLVRRGIQGVGLVASLVACAVVAGASCDSTPSAKPEPSAPSSVDAEPVESAAPSASSIGTPFDACSTPRDCFDLARKYRAGKNGVSRDSPRALALFEQACSLTKGDDYSGCTEQAFMLRVGEGVPKDERRALEVYRAICARGVGVHCNLAAQLLDKPTQLPRDDAAARSFRLRAAELLEKRCSENDARACNAFGYMHFKKEVAQPSMERAARAFQQSCDGKYTGGCDSLGFMELNGAGISKNESDALRHFRVACDAGVGDSCVALGFMLHFGRGTTADEAGAVAAFSKACTPMMFGDMERGCQTNPDPWSCGMSALMAAMGTCTTKDLGKAQALAAVACPAPYTWHCDRIKEVAARAGR